jgi:hypothetical protein
MTTVLLTCPDGRLYGARGKEPLEEMLSAVGQMVNEEVPHAMGARETSWEELRQVHQQGFTWEETS